VTQLRFVSLTGQRHTIVVEVAVRSALEQLPASAAAARGAWAALPESTTNEDALCLGNMIHGYSLTEALGWGPCVELAKKKREQYQRTKVYAGTAAELWCCLFMLARAYRHTDWPGRNIEEPDAELVELYRTLVAQLRAGDGSVVMNSEPLPGRQG
jgi:hypothetical protein